MEGQGVEVVCFTVIVDDIVLPNGETVMEVLGGGGPQTLFGYQLVTGQTAAVGLSAGVGPDMPERCKAWLRSIGCDVSGLIVHDRPTPRAWQVFEEWGRRTQVWRGRDDPCDQLYDMLRPRYDTMPPAFQCRTSNYHLGVHPLHPPRRLLARLRAAAHAAGGVLSVEPYTAAETPASPSEAAELLAHCDVFSPNEAEAESIVGPAGSPAELARRLLALSPAGGADVVVVRCGPAGVLAARRAAPGGGVSQQQLDGLAEAAEAVMVPAVADTAVVDVTGCGNAFCGGFLAALYRGAAEAQRTTAPAAAGAGGDSSSGNGGAGAVASSEERAPAWLARADLAGAAAWGCVAASFMAEARGVPLTPISQLQDRARQRYAALRPRVHPVRLPRANTSARVHACAAASVSGPASCRAAIAAKPARQASMARAAAAVTSSSLRAGRGAAVAGSRLRPGSVVVAAARR
ncbi:hypothetical protein CHLRE_02g088300v5 [Chlamydomonas reinhardtii]|uniref:Carbohydrate kinase PfkB domain-containing protein n=1 Tax=Chlamydomonas reinhardtii TaxID=3055 RepID=A0A2K3E127_CHLRE|nr:uncharacterized protein CHLRE_02g088300v5 [Chlamydomonas reinhardtii]PNW86482.1 hypothetical protein CHLRE_02g088300v5 [Chlamydomonas reinhardtii]